MSNIPDLPRYRCHKEVGAIKIGSIVDMMTYDTPDAPSSSMKPAGAMLYAAGQDGPTVYVDAAYMEKHKPQVGGYFVVYDDGYQSFSPAKAFEDGYVALSRLGSIIRA